MGALKREAIQRKGKEREWHWVICSVGQALFCSVLFLLCVVF